MIVMWSSRIEDMLIRLVLIIIIITTKIIEIIIITITILRIIKLIMEWVLLCYPIKMEIRSQSSKLIFRQAKI